MVLAFRNAPPLRWGAKGTAVELTRRRSLVLLGMCAVLGCKTRDSGEERMSSQNETSESLSHLSQELGLQFPPSTRVLGVLRSNGMDDAVRVKLEIAAGEFPSFLERPQIDRASFRPGTRGMLGPDKDFWDPHQSQSLRTGQVARPNARSLNLGFDDSRGDSVIVYLMEHGT
jgi:hypothetical protein